MKAQRHLTWVGLMLKVTVVFSNGGYGKKLNIITYSGLWVFHILVV